LGNNSGRGGGSSKKEGTYQINGPGKREQGKVIPLGKGEKRSKSLGGGR